MKWMFWLIVLGLVFQFLLLTVIYDERRSRIQDCKLVIPPWMQIVPAPWLKPENFDAETNIPSVFQQAETVV